MVESLFAPVTERPAWREISISEDAAAALAAKGVASDSSAVEIRLMSAIALAPRKASRNLSELRFRAPNSSILVIKVIQERIEASARPTMTNFTTSVAPRNSETTFALWRLASGAG